jgi:flagellar M-ring protein FliF
MTNKLIGLSIGGVAIAVLVTFLAYSFFSNRWVPVVEGELSESAKSEIESKLMEWRQLYRVRESDNAILILSQEVVGIRSRLESIGLPAEQKQGFEVFDDSDYGLSEFVQNVNYRRALEAELERSIRKLAGINGARVHLTLKRESIFKDKRVSAKASVIVRFEENYNLTPAQIHGIQKIVSSGVEELEADSVVVTNESGAVISNDDYPFAGSTQFQDVELKLRSKIENVVNTFLGGNNDFSVALTVDINMDRVQSVKDTVLPNGNSEAGLLVKKSQQTKAGAAGKKADGIQQSHTEEEYVYSREKSEIMRAIGKVDHISVAVVVDGWISEEERIMLEKIIIAAGGLSIKRNDSVVVAMRAGDAKAGSGDTLVDDVINGSVRAIESVAVSIDKEKTHNRQAGKVSSVKNPIVEDSIVEDSIWVFIRNNIVAVIACLLGLAGSLVFVGYFIAVRVKQSIPKLTEQERELLMEELEKVLST